MNDNDRAQQEELIFAQAVQVESEAERSAYLDEACRGQPELRQRLELLLEGYFRSPGFLDDQDPGPVKTNPAIRGAAVPEEEIGAIIGRYKLLEKVG